MKGLLCIALIESWRTLYSPQRIPLGIYTGIYTEPTTQRNNITGAFKTV